IAVCQLDSTSSTPTQWVTCQKMDTIAGAEPEEEKSFQSQSQANFRNIFKSHGVEFKLLLQCCSFLLLPLKLTMLEPLIRHPIPMLLSSPFWKSIFLLAAKVNAQILF